METLTLMSVAVMGIPTGSRVCQSSSRSSAVADERTATNGSSCRLSYASRIVAATADGRSADMMSSRARCSAAASAAESSLSTSTASNSSSAMPAPSMNARYVSAVTTNPGGTGSPASDSSPSDAPLPPTVSISLELTAFSYSSH